MFKLVGSLLLVMAFSWAGSATAAHMTTIYVDGKEWLQPVDFINNSWNQIAEVCNPNTGVCTGSLNGIELTGWTWANSYDTSSLFNFFIGFDAVHGGGDIFNTFEEPSPTVWLDAFYDAGFISMWGPCDPCRTMGYVADRASSTYSGLAGLGRNYVPDRLTDWASYVPNWGDSDFSTPEAGGWFYREQSTVPIPATLPLLGLGLAALGFSRRKRIRSWCPATAVPPARCCHSLLLPIQAAGRDCKAW
jgi:hypothetical protein